MEHAGQENHSNSADETDAGSPPSVEAENRSVSSTANGDDGDVTRSSEAIARGLSAMLASVIRDFDSKAQDAMKSQDELSDSLDRLIQELDQLLENAPLPFIVQHAARISVVRKRVLALNSLLKSIQRRVDNIDQMLSVGMSHEKTALKVPEE